MLDKEHKLAYHGQFDDSRPKVANPLPVTGACVTSGQGVKTVALRTDAPPASLVAWMHTWPRAGKDLRAALDAVLEGKPAPKSRFSIGCNIKWIPGKEPAYAFTQLVKA